MTTCTVSSQLVMVGGRDVFTLMATYTLAVYILYVTEELDTSLYPPLNTSLLASCIHLPPRSGWQWEEAMADKEAQPSTSTISRRMHGTMWERDPSCWRKRLSEWMWQL